VAVVTRVLVDNAAAMATVQRAAMTPRLAIAMPVLPQRTWHAARRPGTSNAVRPQGTPRVARRAMTRTGIPVIANAVTPPREIATALMPITIASAARIRMGIAARLRKADVAPPSQRPIVVAPKTTAIAARPQKANAVPPPKEVAARPRTHNVTPTVCAHQRL